MATTTWTLDPAHSELQFKVKHLMITNVTGSMPAISGTIESSDDRFADANVSFSADVNSITTNNEQRDEHLKGDDFFETNKFPSIQFVSKKYDASEGKITGDLTIKGTTKPITLDVEFGGATKDPWGNEKAGFSLSGKLNRKDFGLSWNAALETGGVMVSEEVKLSAELQFVKQAN